MITVISGAFLLVALIALPRVLGIARRTSPKSLGCSHVTVLVGWAVLVVAALACGGEELAARLARFHSANGNCLFGLHDGQWQVIGFLPALIVLLALFGNGVRLAVGARRAELRGIALASSRCYDLPSGPVWIVPSQVPAAYAAGLFHPRAVVTSGLVASLGEDELRAVCAHEAAHVRLGHPRTVLVTGSIASTFGMLAPIKSTWDDLRQDLENAADDEAIRVLGSTTLLSALLKTAEQRSRTCERTLSDSDHTSVSSRINRLGDEKFGAGAKALTIAATGSITLGLALLIAINGCALTGTHRLVFGIPACLAVVSIFSARPIWTFARKPIGAAHHGRSANDLI